MSKHIVTYLIGSGADVQTYMDKQRPDFDGVVRPILNPGELDEVTINPWDNIVFGKSFMDWSPEDRQAAWMGVSDAKRRAWMRVTAE